MFPNVARPEDGALTRRTLLGRAVLVGIGISAGLGRIRVAGAASQVTLGLASVPCQAPAYAAIAQTVELAKRRHGLGASKLVNAVLRRTDREREGLGPAGGPPSDPVEALSLKYSHPRWLVARWVERWGEHDTEQLLTVNNAEAPIILRPYGIVREQLEAMLEEAGVHIGDAPYLRESIAISGGITLTELGAFKKGLFFGSSSRR